MNHCLRMLRFAMAIIVALYLGGAAEAQTVPHREHVTGALTDVQPGSMSFIGQGVGTHLGKFIGEGGHNFDDQGNVFNGHFTLTAANRATISGTYSGTYTVLASGKIRFDVHVIYLQGTGRLAGVTGQADVVAILDSAEPGGTFEYITRGALSLP